MARGRRDITIRILGDPKDFERGLSRASREAASFGRQMDRSSGVFATATGRIGKEITGVRHHLLGLGTTLTGVAGVAGLAGFVGVMEQSVEKAGEYEAALE